MYNILGKTLGKYQIVERLGKGGMAEVFKAYQPSLDRYVAVKVLNPFLLEKSALRQRFEREAKNIATLRHPHIINVFDYDQEGDAYYMVMEFIEGISLKDYLWTFYNAGQSIPIQKGLQIVKGIAEALSFAHKNDMVHRDVKPANVMLDKSGNVILTDFGIAKILSSDTDITASGTTMGTPAYMAPEQAKGVSGDYRIDIYSLGVLLYELATGKLPYDADTPMGVILKKISTPPHPPSLVNPEFPQDLEKVILKALAIDPDERYQFVDEVIEDLNKISILFNDLHSKPSKESQNSNQKDDIPQDIKGKRKSLKHKLIESPIFTKNILKTAPQIARSSIFAAIGLIILILAGLITSTAFGARVTLGQPTPADHFNSEHSLLTDDFSNPYSGWDRDRDASGVTDYENGVYRIIVNVPDNTFYSLPGKYFSDVIIDVDATKMGGPNNNTFGVICGYKDAFNFYYFVITSDGMFGIGKFDGGIPSYIEMEQLQSSEAIRQGGSTNHIQAKCIDKNLTLEVNNQHLATVQDNQLEERKFSGDIGLIAGTSSKPGVDIAFDNLLVSKP